MTSAKQADNFQISKLNKTGQAHKGLLPGLVVFYTESFFPAAMGY